jgi:PIN domain
VIVRPRPTVTSEALLRAVDEALSRLSQTRGSGNSAFERLNFYLGWVHDQVRQFSLMVRREDLDYLILTRRYWSLQALDPAAHAPTLNDLLNLEYDERQRDLEDVRNSLRQEIARWQSRSGFLVLPDTNVYLHHLNIFDQVEWGAVAQARAENVHVLIPLLVIDELDNNKRSNKPEVRERARATLRRLDELFPQPGASAVLQPSDFPRHGEIRAEILTDDAHHERLPRADDELVDLALATQALAGRIVRLVTFDKGMAVRGRTAGLTVDRLDASEERPDEERTGRRRGKQRQMPTETR